MNGEVYLAEDDRGWLAIHESRHGDSSGMEGPFRSFRSADHAGRDLAKRLNATFVGAPSPLADMLEAMLGAKTGRRPA